MTELHSNNSGDREDTDAARIRVVAHTRAQSFPPLRSEQAALVKAVLATAPPTCTMPATTT